MDYKELQELLALELERRKKVNARYSLRAFARSLGVEPSHLSKILRGDVNPSHSTTMKIASKLIQNESIVSKISEIDSKRRIYRSVKKKKLKDFSKSKLGLDLFFRSALDYHVHLALSLSLPDTTIEGLSKYFGINKSQIESSLAHLQKHNLIFKNEAGGFEVKIPQTADDPFVKTNDEKKKLQLEFLNKAKQAILSVPQEKRLNGTLSFTVDEKLLNKLKTKIDLFLRELNAWSSVNSKRTDTIYNFSIALYPVMKEDSQ